MKRLALLGVLGTLAIGTSAVASTAAVTPAAGQALAPAAVTQQVTGTIAGGAGTLAGTLTVTGFQVVNGVVNAVGNLSYTLTDTAGNVIGSGTQAISLPLQATGSCQILHLELGPLDLNLLGLMVHLDRVVLDITAQSGPGNLLGNLLCAVAHLLDSNGSATAIANLLNNLLRA